MARKKTKWWQSNASAQKKKPTESPYRVPLLMGATALLLCLMTAGIVVGISKLWHAITHMNEFHVRPGQATLNSDWIREDAFRAELLRVNETLEGAAAEREKDAVALLQGSYSLFEDNLALRVADAYRRSPYVRRVQAVTKEFPNHLDIRLQIREPFTVVCFAHDKRKAYVLDEDGIVLSNHVYKLTPPDRLLGLLPVVVVNKAQGYPCPGRVWGDIAVLEGIKMLRLCREQFLDEVAIREIEVTRVTRRDGTASADAWLTLKSGTRVHWGSTPSAIAIPGVASTPEKTAAFLALARKEGDQLNQRRIIDLRLRTLIVE